ncbi:hypothetical protein T2812B_07505 [Thermotoga sp. 2812B]|nr:hypothetical protein T2812B_07505 [Thermotoga sp. 2812B]
MEFLNDPVVDEKVYLSFCDGLKDRCGDRVGNCDECTNSHCVGLCNTECDHVPWWKRIFLWW